jgi:hypothetical protein
MDKNYVKINASEVKDSEIRDSNVENGSLATHESNKD